MHSTVKALSLVALACTLLAGCGGDGMMPGQGTAGGLGTPGSRTGDPDATLVFRLRGSSAGDFEATDVKATHNALGFQIQGSATAGPSTGRITRVATIRFNGLPVKGVSYTVGGSDVNGVVVQYVEKNVQTSQSSVWEGASGTVRVGNVTSTHVEASFGAVLEDVLGANPPVTVSAGYTSVKFQ